MSAESSPGRLTLLLVLAGLLLAGSGVSYYLLQARQPSASHLVPTDALYNLALDAGGAVAGDM
ncbi:MAG TPA: hypothetical protein VF764_03530, partial [Steroidobacteraceae bacterium]